MSGRLDGKVAFITGAARGQGRAHAVRLAREGADILALDICRAAPGRRALRLGAPRTTSPQTAKEVEATGRRVLTHQGDVRDLDGMKAFVAAGVAEFGRLDIVVANAGICIPMTLGRDDAAGLPGHDRHQRHRGLEHRHGDARRTSSPAGTADRSC